jgi:hypothetical protein
MLATEPMPAPTQRPLTVTIVAVIGLVYAILLIVSGVLTLGGADGERGELIAGSLDLFFAAAILVATVGAYRVERWAWVMFMTLAAWSLGINLLRDLFFGDPRYLPLAVGAFVVFLLTPFDVQVAFGVRAPPNVRLDSPTRNPLDRV